ncbi:hypothetical protein LCGC14_3160430, partial [marine sediment metagenome]
IKEEPPEDEGPPLSDLPGISVKSGLIKAGGNRKLYQKLLSKFHRNHSDVANGIRNALDMVGPDTATRLAHTIKGVAGNIGARNLYLAATDLEAALRQKQIGNIAGLLDAFSEALDLVLDSIVALEYKEPDAARARMSAEPVLESIDRDRVLSLLRELREFLEEDDTQAVRTLEALREALPATVSVHPKAAAYRQVIKVKLWIFIPNSWFIGRGMEKTILRVNPKVTDRNYILIA